MKNTEGTITIEEIKNTAVKKPQRTAPVLLKAWKVLENYAKATGTVVCAMDANYSPIPEIFSKITGNDNTCLYCMKYLSRVERPEQVQDLAANPCTKMHINAIKKACHFGGSYIYMCDLGFMFWTSPIFMNSHFMGALLSSGFLGIDKAETLETMQIMSNGEIPEEQLAEHLSAFPHGEPERVKALAELLLICAESLSVDKEDYHETLKRRAQQQTIIAEQIAVLKEQYPGGAGEPGYPLDKERMLLGALRRGDNEMGKKVLNELLGALFFSNPDHFNYIRFRAIELVVLLSRTAVSPGNTESAILETNNQYLTKIQEVENVEELTDVLHRIVEDMASQIFSFRGARHALALRKAERFIYENYTRKISLKEIADASGLSAPYFSTIFKEEMGENLSTYLNRLRVEKASRFLMETDMTLSEIAGSCGFEDQSWFSKIFKSFTGVSPGRFRVQGGGTKAEISENNVSQNYRDMLNTEE